MNQSGSVAVVTGAASGIGAATAERLARDGAAVVLADVAEQAGDAVRARIADAGGRAVFVRADAAAEEDWARVVEAAHAFGPVNVLVSNAYASEVAAAHETSLASWDRQLAVSLTGSFLGFRAVLPDLREQGGSAVLVSSVHARFGMPGHPAYAAAKGALVSLCGQLAVEYAPRVRVNVVLPGPIMTSAWDRIGEADRRLSVAATPAGRFGTPEEVAAAIAFLAGPQASFITGTSLVVDGGWSVAKASA
jgi:NAD(P)-dependent dehydrogenase (short-subunit alcohol dehydrogenase family)